MADLLAVQEGPVLRLMLNRPERLNAFSREMLDGMTEALVAAAVDPAIRVVIIRGAGRAFSAGGDVQQMGSASGAEVAQHISILNRTVMAMVNLPKPVIAQVHGVAAGAGFNLALAADLVVASEEARFIMSFIQVGLISDGGGSYWLTRTLGPRRAKEHLFLGEPLSASHAQDLGLANRVVPLADLDSETDALAQRLVEAPASAIREMKRLVNRSAALSLGEVLEEERAAQAFLAETADHQEGIRAFLEKRRPTFGKKETHGLSSE